MVGKDVIAEIGSTCLLMRTRLISRGIAGIYDEKLRPFGIGAAQFASLRKRRALLGKDGVIAVMEIANRIMDPEAYPLSPGANGSELRVVTDPLKSNVLG